MTGLRAVRRQPRKRQRMERGGRTLGLLVAKGPDPASLLWSKRPTRFDSRNGNKRSRPTARHTSNRRPRTSWSCVRPVALRTWTCSTRSHSAPTGTQRQRRKSSRWKWNSASGLSSSLRIPPRWTELHSPVKQFSCLGVQPPETRRPCGEHFFAAAPDTHGGRHLGGQPSSARQWIARRLPWLGLPNRHKSH